MKLSQLFTKTRREAPKDEASKNADLLIRAGYIHKDMAGVYSYLPLGLTVLNNIIQVIRKEMNLLGANEVSLAALQNKETWMQTGRWSDDVIDVWFKSELKNGTEVGFGVTHEDPLTNLMKSFISSYRDLPTSVYQFQTKFRNETRAKSGIMRCREFVMKDLYSFNRNREEHDTFYSRVRQSYINIYDKLGIGHITYPTFASGGAFSKFSEEFQTITDAGEDTIYVHEQKKIAVNKEVYQDDILADLGLNKAELVEKKSVEVGNIFTLGTRFSEPLELHFKNEQGVSHPVFMGSYGIGPGRVMGTIVELLSDDKGIVWPEEIAPAQVHVVVNAQGEQAETVLNKAEQYYADLTNAGIKVIMDDRDMGMGAKLADAELMGIPHIVIISSRSLAAGGVEYRSRKAHTETGQQIIDMTVEGVHKYLRVK